MRLLLALTFGLSLLACAGGPSDDELLALARDRYGTHEQTVVITFSRLQNSQAQNCGVPDRWAGHGLFYVDVKPETWYSEDVRGKEVLHQIDGAPDTFEGPEACLVEQGLFTRLDYTFKKYACTEEEWVAMKGGGRRMVPADEWQPQWAAMARARFDQAPLQNGTAYEKTDALLQLWPAGSESFPHVSGGRFKYVTWRETIDVVVAAEPFEEFGMKGYRGKFRTEWEPTTLGKCLGSGPEAQELEYHFVKEYDEWKVVG